MPNYRRAYVAGGTYFFTVNLLERRHNDLLTRHISLLRRVVQRTRELYPFEINAWVVLPEHMHCVWTLPEGDNNFSTRWRLIKKEFSRQIPRYERLSNVRKQKGERGIWQRRFWEHCIRDERDYGYHIDYVHYNPVKHGLVKNVIDWPYSSFHRYVQQGIYPANWVSDINS